jgi:uncharacterized Zn finger protein
VDVHVAVLAEESRRGRDYGEIVSVLRTAGRDSEAEEWVRRDLADDPSSPWTDGLREQLAELLVDTGRADEAVAMYREVFERRTMHRDFLRLQVAAGRPSGEELIGLRENANAADVLGPLERLIELRVERTGDKYRYPKAIKGLRRLRDNYERAADATGFDVYLVGLRERQRHKHSFIAKLDATFGVEAS